MKKISKVITTIVLLLSIFIGVKMYYYQTYTDYYIATIDLNVRTGPGTKYSISFALQKGDEVEFLSKKNNWYQINCLGNIGYAYSRYLKYSRTIPNSRFESFQQTISYTLIGIITGIIFLVCFIIFQKIRDKKLLKTVTKSNRGTRSERNLVLKLLRYGIPAQMIFHDLYLKKSNNDFSQIDLVVITEIGIIVFEVKDYSGWIYGSGNQSYWTKVLAYGKQKYRFYNPIMQNNKHIEVLKRKLNHLMNIPFYSIVLFYGDCVLKDINFVPNGTFIVKSNRVLEVIKLIMKNKPVQYPNKNAIVNILKEAVEYGEYEKNKIQHIENIKDMLGKERIFD